MRESYITFVYDQYSFRFASSNISRVLTEAKILTKHLQEEKMDYSTAIDLVRGVQSCLTHLTDENWFDEIWSDILDLCQLAEVAQPIESTSRQVRNKYSHNNRYGTKIECLNMS